MRTLRSLLLALWALGVWAPAAPAQPSAVAQSAPAQAGTEDLGRRVQRLSDELRSPFCPGKTLMTCTSPQAYHLRQEMTELVQAGYSDEDIVAELKVRYGADIANPPQPWYTAIVPALPFVFGALMLAWVGHLWLRGARQRADAQSALATDLQPEGADAERLAQLRARVARFDDEE